MKVLLSLFLSLASFSICFGWTYVPVSDTDLIHSADSIVLGTIHSSIDGNLTGIKGPWSHYEVGISYVLKSSEDLESRIQRLDTFSQDFKKTSTSTADKTITVSVIGGFDHKTGRTLHVTAAPTFHDGDSVLLFLTHDDTSGDEINQLTHFALGAFHKVEINTLDAATSSEQSSFVLVRSMDIVGNENDEVEVSVRKYGEFIRYIVRQVSVGQQEQLESEPSSNPSSSSVVASDSDSDSYWTKTTMDQIDPQDSSLPTPRFNTFKYQQRSIRWRTFDSKESVSWSIAASGQIGLEGGATKEIRQAMAVWNDQPNTPISYQEGSPTDAVTAFFSSDSVNSILFEDPKNVIAGKYQCGVGGTLALGGWWTNGEEYSFRDIQFTEIVEADIVLQDGIGCWFTKQNDPSASYANLITHEMGHTLGLDHSCGDSDGNCVAGSDEDNSVMRAYVHNDAGAFLAVDDNRGIEYIYSSCYPNCVSETLENESEILESEPKILGLSKTHSAIVGGLAAFVVAVAVVVLITLIVVRKRKNAQREQVRSRSSSLIIDPYDHIDIPGYMNVGAQTYISPTRMSYYDHFAAVSNNLNNIQQQQNAKNSSGGPTSPYRSPRPYSNLNLNLQEQTIQPGAK